MQNVTIDPDVLRATLTEAIHALEEVKNSPHLPADDIAKVQKAIDNGKEDIETTFTPASLGDANHDVVERLPIYRYNCATAPNIDDANTRLSEHVKGLEEEDAGLPAPSLVDELGDTGAIRFRANGTAIDIPVSVLRRWPDTQLAMLAREAIRNGKVAKDGTPLVVLARDAKNLRVIRHYMETGEPICPPNDSVERQLLIADAGFYILPQLIAHLMTGHRPAPPPTDQKVGAIPGMAINIPTKVESKLSAIPVDLGRGRVGPSPVTLHQDSSARLEELKSETQIMAPKDAFPFWIPGLVNDLVEEDAAIRAQELPARIMFRKDQDATAEMRKWTKILFEFSTGPKFGGEEFEFKPSAQPPKYPKLVHPKHGSIPDGSGDIVSTMPEFRTQFQALTLGLLDGIIGTLPVVVAGGSVLAALHPFERKPIPASVWEAISRTLISEKANPQSATALIRALTKQIPDVSWGYSPRWARHHASSEKSLKDRVAELEKILMQRARPTITPTPATRELLEMVVWLAGVKWVNGQPERTSWRESESDTAAEDPADEQVAIAADDLSRIFEVKTAPKTKSDAEVKGDAESKNDAEVKNDAESKGDAEAKSDADATGDAGTKDDSEVKSDADTKGVTEVKDDADRTDTEVAIDNILEESDGEQEDQKSQSVDAKLKEQRKIMMNSFRNTDIDLFLVTRNPDEAYRTIIAIDRKLRAALPKVQIDIMRTDQSVTFILPWPYRNIQVINRLYFSMEHVLLGFDIDACCVGYDGKNVVALPRAIRAIQTRTNLVDPSRQSTTYETRLTKYAKRNFAIAVPGLNALPLLREISSSTWGLGRTAPPTGIRLLLQILIALSMTSRYARSTRNRVVGRTSDYAPHVRNITRRLRACARNGTAPEFAFGTNIIEVLQSNRCVADCFGTVYTCAGTCSPVIAFQLEAPHTQDRTDILYTGAFHPSSADWYGQKAE